jgi:hypothetical protein
MCSSRSDVSLTFFCLTPPSKGREHLKLELRLHSSLSSHTVNLQIACAHLRLSVATSPDATDPLDNHGLRRLCSILLQAR